MAATLEREFHLTAQLIEGSGGIFDVKVDSQLIFSKHEQGRFPEHDEIVDAIKDMTSA